MAYRPFHLTRNFEALTTRWPAALTIRLEISGLEPLWAAERPTGHPNSELDAVLEPDRARLPYAG